MSIINFISPIVALILAVACLACYRNGKPARELLAEKRKAEAEKARKEAERATEQVFTDRVEQAVEAMVYKCKGYNNRSQVNPQMYDLLKRLEKLERDDKSLERLQESVNMKNERLFQLRNEVKEVHRKLAPYA